MNVLTVFAHPGSQSFCHAVLDRFDSRLRDAGHTNEIVDLYRIGFDPILRRITAHLARLNQTHEPCRA